MNIIVLVKGAQFRNKGAELMLDAVVENEIFVNAIFALKPSSAATSRQILKRGHLHFLSLSYKKIDLNILTYFIPLSLRNVIKKRLKIVFESDITLVLDVNGFAYGDHWPNISIKKTISQINRVKKNCGAFVFLPQAFGAMKYLNKKEIEKLNLADVIYARDQKSRQNLLSTGVKPDRINLCGDFTNTIKARNDKKKNQFVLIPNSNMLDATKVGSSWAKEYTNFCSSILIEMQKYCDEVMVINHEGLSDNNVCKKISDDANCEYISNLRGKEIKGILGSSRFVLSSRFHGCVSALSNGTVCLGTSWSHKYEALYDDYGCKSLLIKEPLNEKRISTLVKQVLHDEEHYIRVLKHKSIKLEKNTQDMWNEVKKICAHLQSAQKF